MIYKNKTASNHFTSHIAYFLYNFCRLLIRRITLPKVFIWIEIYTHRRVGKKINSTTYECFCTCNIVFWRRKIPKLFVHCLIYEHLKNTTFKRREKPTRTIAEVKKIWEYETYLTNVLRSCSYCKQVICNPIYICEEEIIWNLFQFLEQMSFWNIFFLWKKTKMFNRK